MSYSASGAGTIEIPNWRAVLPFPAAIDTKLRHSSVSCSYRIGTPRDPEGGIDLAAPPKAGVAPPGYYMPLALHGGVPSVASWVQLTADAPDAPPVAGLLYLSP
jgi:hypothetical protein